MDISTMFKNSILLVAHPDDEILWFSSIFDKVDEVMFCFMNSRSNPQWTIGRKQILSELPIKNVSYLDLEESEVFNGADWANPVITRFGIKITKKGAPIKKYEENYYKIKEKLKNKLINYHNVFTHNPWGEYGNEEHIQIYRIVKEFQKKMKFNLWFSNYCSNKSYTLMLRYISGFDSDYVTLKSNKTLSSHIKNLYIKNGCWTWYEDWVWFNEESFMKDKDLEKNTKVYGHIFPLNMIKEELPRRGFFKIFYKLEKTYGRK
jgi:LmbE family N-acetylglucosaminyl deacetylase